MNVQTTQRVVGSDDLIHTKHTKSVFIVTFINQNKPESLKYEPTNKQKKIINKKKLILL